MTPSPTRSLSSALALVQGLQRFGLAVVVTSPGSRNAPLMQAFDRFGLQTVVALDERAAAHHALGMALALGQPVAVCCTSGTAAMHHGAALAEAFRTGIPLISLTADRPVGADGEWQSQTLPQDGMHAAHVRDHLTWSAESHLWQGALDRIGAALAQGPVHVNCPFEEPLYPEHESSREGVGTQDPEKQHAALKVTGTADVLCDRLSQALEKNERILLLGGTQPLELDATALEKWTAAALVAGDTTSGLTPAGIQTISACDRWLAAWHSGPGDWNEVRPDLIVTFGAPILSRPG